MIRSVPKKIWLLGLIVPGGFAAIGLWLSTKIIYSKIRKKLL